MKTFFQGADTAGALASGLPQIANEQSKAATTHEECTEICIVGAGPYALSLAAHLRGLGIAHRIFGLPMQTWRTEMPQGMFLKSDGFASNLYDPESAFTLKHFYREQGLPYADQGSPISLDLFCAYGMEFQKRFAPDLEKNMVSQLRVIRNGFSLQLDDGRIVHANKVILAVGISHFKHVPAWLSELPSEYCSHSSACTEPSRFAGRDVAIIGAGSSALDLAALLHAAGARARLIARKSSVIFHDGPSKKPRTRWQKLLYPTSGLGPSLRSLFYSEAPNLFHYLPALTRSRIARTYLGPSGGWFIRDQVTDNVEMLLGHNVTRAQIQNGRIKLSLVDNHGATRDINADYVIAATGYQVDMRRLSFLDDQLLSQLQMLNQPPQLSSCFETTISGLHVIGPAAVNSFGPVMRFAFGARFTAKRLSKFLARAASTRRSFKSVKTNKQ